jgi:predicted nuclease with TOPRIM domain
MLKVKNAEMDEQNESLKKQLAESKGQLEKLAKVAEDRKKFSEWQDGLVSESKGREERLEEELRQVKEQLNAKKAHVEELKCDEKLEVEQPTTSQPTASQPAVAQPTATQSIVPQSAIGQAIVYGEMPSGLGFLKGKSFTRKSKEYRGEM